MTTRNLFLRELYHLRIDNGLSLSEVARRAKCERRTLQRWERGTAEPSFSSLQRWVDALNYELNLSPKP